MKHFIFLILTGLFFSTTSHALQMQSRASADMEIQAVSLRVKEAPTARIQIAVPKVKSIPIGTEIGRLRVGTVLPSPMGKITPRWIPVEGGYVTHLEVHVENAKGVRVKVALSDAKSISHLRAAAHKEDFAEAMDIPETMERAEIWSPYTEGSAQTVELFSRLNPAGAIVEVVEAVQFDRSLREVPAENLVTTCIPDVACTSNDAVLDAAIAERKKSVARINFVDGGSAYACTGTLINSGQFPAPFFLTANHCISTAAAAASVTSLWFYEAPVCGGAASGAQQQVAGGAQLLFTNYMVDSTLLRLNNNPPAGAVYAGWNAAKLNAGEVITSISHPEGGVMKYAEGIFSKLVRPQGFPQDMYGIHFTNGIIRPGSSGSGLFTLANGSLQLRGILSGGTIQYGGLSCTSDQDIGLYGRFEIFHPQIAAILQGVQGDPSDDPNQPTPSARVVPFDGNLSATLDYAGDIDVFRIDVPQEGMLTVFTTGGNDLVGALLNSAGAGLDSNDDAESRNNEFGMTYRVSPGTYYVSIGHFEPNATASYKIHAQFSAVTDNYTGLWWNPDESGWGINLNHQGNILFATLFTYDTDGSGMWLVMSYGPRQPDGSYLGNLYRTTGPAFNAAPFTPITAADITKVGSMRLTFSTINSAILTYDVNGVNVSKAITRQAFATLPTCEFSAFDRSYNLNFQDLWWNPGESGWGINLAHQGNILFATLFTYDANGKGLWLVMSRGEMQAPVNDHLVFSGTLYRTTGPVFNAVPWVPIIVTPVGTMRLEFSNGNSASLTYDVNNISVTKQIQRQVFGVPATACKPE